MSHEFTPTAPRIIPTESRSKGAAVVVTGGLTKYKKRAEDIYERALKIAEGIDIGERTTVPLRENAVQAALLLSLACVRGAQIS